MCKSSKQKKEMPTNQQVIADFRRILKHYKNLPSFKSKNSLQRQHLLEQVTHYVDSNETLLTLLQQYTIGRKETDAAKIERLRHTAHSYATLVSDVRQAKYLRGLDSGEKLDPRDKIRATAARVGLGVPKVITNNQIIFNVLII